jgi:hypothetical protein
MRYAHGEGCKSEDFAMCVSRKQWSHCSSFAYATTGVTWLSVRIVEKAVFNVKRDIRGAEEKTRLEGFADVEICMRIYATV